MNECLPCVETETAANPTASVLWLHGLGADGHDFAAIVPELDLAGCPPIRFVFPHAPSMPVTLNGGYVMPAWYDVFGPVAPGREDEAGIRKSALAIEALLSRERARGIASERIVLAGFSQGCAMALHTGLRHAHRLAGVVALSGYLPLAAKLAAECSDVNRSVPVFMAHGSQDPVVVPSRGEASCKALQALGYSVDWHSYAMPHSVHPAEIADIGRFLQRVLTTG